ncbi:hypothetical protein ZWY2020_003170 [Hordeum vulgare]|nr:hypothetical protein ZWY2020_003170 [Hordeum vulgare]
MGASVAGRRGGASTKRRGGTRCGEAARGGGDLEAGSGVGCGDASTGECAAATAGTAARPRRDGGGCCRCVGMRSISSSCSVNMSATTLLRRVTPTPAATNAVTAVAAVPVQPHGHPTLAAPVCPPASPILCCPSEFPPGFMPTRSGARSQADLAKSDLGPDESQPRGSPASDSSVVLETPPVPAAPSAPCVGPRPLRRVRFNVPDTPAGWE